MSVYDDQKTKSEADQLRHITGIGPAEERAMEQRASKGINNPAPAGTSPVAASGLLKAESNPTTDPSNRGVSSDMNPSFINRAKTKLKSRKAKWAIGGGGAVAGLGVTGLLLIGNLFPILRVNNIVESMQNHFYAGSEAAADKTANMLLRTYIVKKVIPGMVENKCTSTKINRSCAAPSGATNPVSALFSTWRDAKLEYKLYERYGIEIQRQGNNFYFRSNNLDNRIALGTYDQKNPKNFNNKAFTQLNRNDIRKELRRGLADETLYKRVQYRFLIGRLLEKKYNIRRCLMACAARDRASDTIDAKKNAFSSWLNERVVAPRSEMYSLVVDCALSSFDCVEGDEIDKEGAHTSQFERDLQVRLAEYKLRYGETSLNKLYEGSQDFRNKGATEFFIGKLLGETSAKLTLKAIPIVGWVDLAARIVKAGENAGPALKKLGYVTLAQTAVSTYMMYRVSADELKAGQADITEIGSFNEALDASPTNDQGGMAGEDSPVFDAINGSGQNTLAAALLPTASAAGTVGPYGCNDGQPLDSKEVACPEEKVGAGSWAGTVANYSTALAKSPLYKVQGITADIWLSTIGKVFDLIGKGVGYLTEKILGALIPQIIKDKIAEVSKSIVATIVEWIIPSPITDHTSGARLVQIAAIGADISANEAVHYGMGGRSFSDAETLAMRQEQENLQESEFNNRSFFARMFSTDSPRSFITKLAVATPHNFTQFSTSVTSVLSNPLRTIGNSFAALIPNKSAGAAVITNPFGVTQYGWSDEDIAAVGFADDYWDANCKDIEAFNVAWGEKAVENADNGMFDNATTNPCLMIQAGVGMAGGRYNEKLIPATDTAVSSGTSGSSTSTVGPLDQATLYQDSTNIQCAPGTKDVGVHDGYSKGVKVHIRICAITGFKSWGAESHDGYGVMGAGGDLVVNSRVSANILALFQAAAKDGVKMDASSGFRSMAHQLALCNANYACQNGDFRKVARPGYSNHQMGLAVDFAEPNNLSVGAQTCATRVRDTSSAQWKWLNNNAARFGFKQYTAESWHWDVMIMSNRCGGDGS
jgi:hypothetical protein